MNDMSAVIVPKSDQINADSLLAGPITIRITTVDIRPGSEQPVTIHYEGEEGKPWRPCKSMCRVLVAAWGPDAKAYAGKSATLYCDPSVKWGGMEVGGIRISHLSHLDRRLVMALTATKGSKKVFTVETLKEVPAPAKRLKFTDWLPAYTEQMRGVPDLAALATFINAEETAVKIRIEGNDAQKAALAKAEDEVRAVLSAHAAAPASDFPGDWTTMGGLT